MAHLLLLGLFSSAPRALEFSPESCGFPVELMPRCLGCCWYCKGDFFFFSYVFKSFFFYCGKTYIMKFTIFTIVKCAVQQDEGHSRRCAAIRSQHVVYDFAYDGDLLEAESDSPGPLVTGFLHSASSVQGSLTSSLASESPPCVKRWYGRTAFPSSAHPSVDVGLAPASRPLCTMPL